MSVPSDQPGEEIGALLAGEAAAFRAVIEGENRSGMLTRLFDYLLEHSAESRAPKEIEIAMAVFGKSATFDTSRDSMVRRHMSRLRQRLNQFNADKNGPRLQIPKGEYRLVLSSEPENQGEEAPPPPKFRPRPAWHLVGMMAALSVIVWAVLFLAGRLGDPASSLGHIVLWRPVASHERPPIIAVGDVYMMVESGPDGKPRRLVRRPSIQSGRDLDIYLTEHPGEFSKLHDRDIRRVPSPVAIGATAILPLLYAMRADRDIPDIVPVSQLPPEAAESDNVIYVEYFAQLGMLRSSILPDLGFAPGENSDGVRDVYSGKLFSARAAAEGTDSARPAEQSYGYDYGYLASYPGPSGNRILVISGVEDAGLAQMIKLVSDKRQLDLLARRTKEADAFEALYQVRTVKGLIFDTSLVIARPLKMDGAGDAR